MKKEILQVDEERGITRVTTIDERWYCREGIDPESGLPIMEFRPSITFIGHFYPKGKGFEQYLKKNGDDADVILQLAGERGTKIHQACEVLNNGGSVAMTDTFLSNRTNVYEQLTADEYYAVMTYTAWWEKEGKHEYEILDAEDVIWPEVPKTEKNADRHSEPGGLLHFAATRDLRLRRKSDGTTGTVDIKSSKDIYPSHIIQVSAIAEASDDQWQAILQVGYTRTKQGYKFTPVERRMDLVAAAQTIHRYETEGEKPLQRDYPLSLSLDLRKPADQSQGAHPETVAIPADKGAQVPEPVKKPHPKKVAKPIEKAA